MVPQGPQELHRRVEQAQQEYIDSLPGQPVNVFGGVARKR
jgi:hypothetical protein